MTLNKKMINLHNQLLKNEITINQLANYKELLEQYYHEVIFLSSPKKKYTEEGLYAYLQLCNDYYVFSSTGDVLISDAQYDEVMQVYQNMGQSQIIYPDALLDNSSTWSLLPHKAPFMVGSIRKVYSEEGIYKWIDIITEHGRTSADVIISPKFDGVSACLEMVNHECLTALTRYDGKMGFDITKIIKNAVNYPYICRRFQTGYLKVELLVSSENFEKMKLEKNIKYKNRRSATSAIINTPKNLYLSEYITIIPLVWCDENNEVQSVATYSKCMNTNLVNIPTQVFNLINRCKEPDFPYRTDGVVLFPRNQISQEDVLTDVMGTSIAYKINTAIAQTKIEYVYMSVGRTGQATPMIHVKKCDVNETEVSDISLSTVKKFFEMQFHQDETIEIFSAGDVIPQARCMEPKQYPKGSPLLTLNFVCPYCSHTLEMIGEKCYCTNSNCSRIIAGEIIIFITKLGVEGISDSTIETLYQNKLIMKRSDIFKVTAEQIKTIPGFDDTSANNIVSEFSRIKTEPIQADVFLGSLNIKGISIKMCKKIFERISLEDLFRCNFEDLKKTLYMVDGFSSIRAETFIDYIEKHENEILELISIMNIVPSVIKLGNIVFTGFRDNEWGKKFAKIKVPFSNSITKQTMAVVTTDFGRNKVAKAQKKGIPVYLYSEIEEAYEDIKNNIKRIEKVF